MGIKEYKEKVKRARWLRENTDAFEFPSDEALGTLIEKQKRIVTRSVLPTFWNMSPNNRRKRVDALYNRLVIAMQSHDELMDGFWSTLPKERGKLVYDISKEKQRLIFEYGIMMGFKSDFPEFYQEFIADYGLDDRAVDGIRKRIFSRPVRPPLGGGIERYYAQAAP